MARSVKKDFNSVLLVSIVFCRENLLRKSYVSGTSTRRHTGGLVMPLS